MFYKIKYIISNWNAVTLFDYAVNVRGFIWQMFFLSEVDMYRNVGPCSC